MAAAPVIAPARANNAFTAMGALRIVMQEEQLPAMSMLLQDLEQTRMALEDTRNMANENLRAASLSPFRINGRLMTWREFADDRQAMIDRLWDMDSDIGDEDGDDADDDEEDEGIVCVLCRLPRSGNRRLFNMQPVGRWAGLAPGARIICGTCYQQS